MTGPHFSIIVASLPTQQSNFLIVICILQDWFDKFEFLQFEVHIHYLCLIHYAHKVIELVELETFDIYSHYSQAFQ